MAEIDHLVIGAASLAAGADWVERHLGARPGQGGAHEGVGTHNLLLGLGPDCYVEVIAPDPAQPEPAHPRPFDLDEPSLRLSLEAEPALITFVARTTSIEAVAGRLGPRGGTLREMRRGSLAWRMLLPSPQQDMGRLIPPLIQWDGPGAASRLADCGCRLTALEAEHPDHEALRSALAERGLSDSVAVRHSPHGRLVARVSRPDGQLVTLTTG